MNAETSAAHGAHSTAPQTYGFTFGTYTQTGPWTDVRSLPWPDLAALLTHHEIGPKAGTCIVPATFSGTRRHKDDARRIDVVMLDSDTGATLDEIRDAISRRGWAAAISSTHSHLSTRTRVRRRHWERFLERAGDPASAAAAFLEREKGYRAEVAAGPEVVRGSADEVEFRHRPCPKFRIALPLLRPWLAADHPSQAAANVAWKGHIGALAATLGLHHDQSCTDTSRLFFLPRRPADGPPPETAVLEGTPCDLFALPRPDRGDADAPRAGTRGAKRGRRERMVYTDPQTGEVFDLTAWARGCDGRFELVKALRSRRPGMFTGKVVDHKHHIRCVNEEAHTQAGEDAATFVMDASRSEKGVCVYHCRHAHCDGRPQLRIPMMSAACSGAMSAPDSELMSAGRSE